jgi:hypothetical protein
MGIKHTFSIAISNKLHDKILLKTINMHRYLMLASIAIVITLSVMVVADSTTSIPANCRRPSTSHICNADSILTNSTCDEFDKIARDLEAYYLPINCNKLMPNTTVLYATVVNDITDVSDLAEYTRRIYLEWGLNKYCSAVLMGASLDRSKICINLGNSTMFKASCIDLTLKDPNKRKEFGETILLLADIIAIDITGDMGHPINGNGNQNGTDNNDLPKNKRNPSPLFVILGTICLIMFCACLACVIARNLKQKRSFGYQHMRADGSMDTEVGSRSVSSSYASEPYTPTSEESSGEIAILVVPSSGELGGTGGGYYNAWINRESNYSGSNSSNNSLNDVENGTNNQWHGVPLDTY